MQKQKNLWEDVLMWNKNIFYLHQNDNKVHIHVLYENVLPSSIVFVCEAVQSVP